VQGRLTQTPVTAIIGTTCSCCDRPLELLVESDLSYRILTEQAEPVVSVPFVDFAKLKDPSIIHAF
jgi:hypothetical protein